MPPLRIPKLPSVTRRDSRRLPGGGSAKKSPGKRRRKRESGAKGYACPAPRPVEEPALANPVPEPPRASQAEKKYKGPRRIQVLTNPTGLKAKLMKKSKRRRKKRKLSVQVVKSEPRMVPVVKPETKEVPVLNVAGRLSPKKKSDPFLASVMKQNLGPDLPLPPIPNQRSKAKKSGREKTDFFGVYRTSAGSRTYQARWKYFHLGTYSDVISAAYALDRFCDGMGFDPKHRNLTNEFCRKWKPSQLRAFFSLEHYKGFHVDNARAKKVAKRILDVLSRRSLQDILETGCRLKWDG